MHLHVHLPGFQAFALQIGDNALRRRPVVATVTPTEDLELHAILDAAEAADTVLLLLPRSLLR